MPAESTSGARWTDVARIISAAIKKIFDGHPGAGRRLVRLTSAA
jgi:hypothetical protein